MLAFFPIVNGDCRLAGVAQSIQLTEPRSECKYCQAVVKAHRTPLIRTANYPDRLGPSGKHFHILIVKDKVIPLQPWTVPEGSRTFRLPDFKTIGP